MAHLPSPAPGRGVYRYELDGEPGEVEEYFVVRSDGSGTEVRARRTAPGGVELEVAVEERDGHTRCRISFRSDDVSPVLSTWDLADGTLSVTRHDGSTGESSEDEIALEPGAVLSPLMRVFQGPAIAACLSAGGPVAVVVPDLRDPGGSGAMLAPLVEHRSASREGVEVDDGAVLRHCRYVGGNYDEASDFWLDARDRLVRYRYPEPSGGTWSVELVEGA